MRNLAATNHQARKPSRTVRLPPKRRRQPVSHPRNINHGTPPLHDRSLLMLHQMAVKTDDPHVRRVIRRTASLNRHHMMHLKQLRLRPRPAPLASSPTLLHQQQPIHARPELRSTPPTILSLPLTELPAKLALPRPRQELRRTHHTHPLNRQPRRRILPLPLNRPLRSTKRRTIQLLPAPNPRILRRNDHPTIQTLNHP